MLLSSLVLYFFIINVIVTINRHIIIFKSLKQFQCQATSAVDSFDKHSAKIDDFLVIIHCNFIFIKVYETIYQQQQRTHNYRMIEGIKAYQAQTHLIT